MMTLREPKLLSSVGIVCQVTNDIAVKRTFAENNEGIHNEHRMYGMLGCLSYCPKLVWSFYQIPSANLLRYFSGGTVE